MSLEPIHSIDLQFTNLSNKEAVKGSDQVVS